VCGERHGAQLCRPVHRAGSSGGIADAPVLDLADADHAQTAWRCHLTVSVATIWVGWMMQMTVYVPGGSAGTW